MLPSQHFGRIGNVKPANQDKPRLNRCFTNNRSGNRRAVVVRRVLAAATRPLVRCGGAAGY
jgi:hypothetical protein